MAIEEFSLPIDGDFVLYQGWVTRNTRRRRKSDASVPSSMSSTNSSAPSPLPIRSSERRRNTVTASHFYKYTSHMSADERLVQSPPDFLSPPPRYQAIPTINSPVYADDQMPTASSLPADMSQLDTDSHMIILPPSPPHSPPAASQPAYNQLKRQASSLPLPKIPLPPIPEDVSGASSANRASQSSDAAVTCLVLDNKKICFARPRLVQIGSPGSV
ncbi:hypothetical protein IWW55_001422 [Coemansia sp. RSA 2706]|nr:hypothetical protein IWW55_001422 [Coemansia sp. RSA 2706]KAJ2327994.1 hypothetical protein IWW51_001440 [Coemansia sp. RSA 2702]